MSAETSPTSASFRGRVLPRLVRTGVLLTAVPVAWACATASARGVVRDEGGRPIPGATVGLSPEREPDDDVTATSGTSGCFGVLTITRAWEATFLLTVRAPGYKPLSTPFPRQKRLTAAVTLVAEGQAGDSSLARLGSPRELKEFEARCVPVYPPGSTGLGIR